MDVQKLSVLIIAYNILKKSKKQRRKKNCWVRPWIQRRQELGACSTLARELHIEDAQQYRYFVRFRNLYFYSARRRLPRPRSSPG